MLQSTSHTLLPNPSLVLDQDIVIKINCLSGESFVQDFNLSDLRNGNDVKVNLISKVVAQKESSLTWLVRPFFKHEWAHS